MTGQLSDYRSVATGTRVLSGVIRDSVSGSLGISATVIRVAPPGCSTFQQVPVARSCSFQASWAARATLRCRLADGGADALVRRARTPPCTGDDDVD